MEHRLPTRKRDRIKVWLNRSAGNSVTGTSGTAPPTQGSPDHVRTAQDAPSRSLWNTAINGLSPGERSALDATGSKLDILTSILTTAQDKQELCERHQWEISFLGKRYVLRNIIENIIVHLRNVREVVDTIVSWDPAHMALPWAAVKFLLQCAISENEQHSLLLIGLEKVACQTSRCFVYEKLYLQEDQQEPTAAQSRRNLETALLNLYLEILKFLSRANKAFSQHAMKRSFTAWLSAEGLKKQLQSLDSLEGTVYLETANHSVVKLSDGQIKLQQLFKSLEYPVSLIDSRVSAIHKRLDREERQKILRWISDLPYEAHHYSARKGKTAGTGKWLLDDDKYRQWEGSDSSRVLWLHGSPGVGKTKLATTVVDDLSQTYNSGGRGLVYFYCDRNQSSRRNPTEIVASLVRQLSARAPDVSLPFYVIDEYERKQDNGFSSGALNIEESMRLFRQLTKPLSLLTVIIDALDECEIDSRIQLVNFLNGEADQPSKVVKIFLTSRDHRDIKQRLESGPNLKINASHNQGDIATYIRDRIGKGSPSWWEGHVDEDLRGRICDTLVEKCDDMFQWAVLQINQLFKLSLRSEILDRLGKLPKDLGRAYDEIHEVIKSQEGYAPIIAARAFRWVMCHETPSEKLLVAAVCQDPSASTPSPVNVDIDAEYILHACSNLLIHLRFDSVDEFRFSHLSVREHLETHLATTAQSHALVGKVCLALLMDPVYQALEEELSSDLEIRRWYNAMFAAKIGGYLDREKSLKTKDANTWVIKAERKGGKAALKRISPLVNYARYNGIGHLRRAGRAGFSTDLDPRDLLWGFFGSFEHTAAGFESWHAFNFGPSIGREWAGDEKLSKPWHRPTQSFPGKTLFAICLTRLDDITQELWQTWPLDDDVQDLAGNPLIRAIASTNSVVMARYAFENGKIRNVEAIKSSFSLTGRRFIPGQRNAIRNEMERLLLENGADDESGQGIFRNALESMISTGDETLLRRLLESGADVNGGGGEYGYALRTAAERGSISGLKLLLEYGADVEVHSSGEFPCPLQAAAFRNQIDTVAILLDHGANVNACSGTRGYALHAAASSHAIEVVRLLISHGADVNACEFPYSSAISAAANDPNIVRLLLENGGDPNLAGGLYTLQAAALCKNLDTLKVLLASGADAKASCDRAGSALHAAAASGYVDSVDLLLDYGADVNGPSEEYGPVLQAGVANIDVIRVLLNSGADVNAFGGVHGYALHAAAKQKNFDVVKILLDHEANVNAIGGEHGYAIQVALHGGSGDIAQLLLDHGANADVYGGPHEYTLQAAILSKCFDVIELLLKSGADVNACGSQFGCALQAAASTGAFKTVKLLLAHGANPNIKGGLYNSPIQAAASSDPDTTELLLTHGADITVRGGKHGTVLHAAVWCGDLDTVKLLLDRGAEVNAKDNEGKTCLGRLKETRWCQREIVVKRMAKLLGKYGGLEETEMKERDGGINEHEESKEGKSRSREGSRLEKV